MSTPIYLSDFLSWDALESWEDRYEDVDPDEEDIDLENEYD